jgi:putative endonuclease
MKRAIETNWGYQWSGKIGWPYRLRTSATKAEVGRWGEWLALRHVRNLGWDVVARNWRNRRGELDLIAYDSDRLVIVEVRTRRQGPSGFPPEETVDTEKESRLETLAMDFLRRFEITDCPLRLDVIGIETPDGAHFELRHFSL